MAMASAYFSPGADREPSQFTPEMSRRARGVELWAALRSLGRAGLAALIDRTCSHAKVFADGLRDRGCDILNERRFQAAPVAGRASPQMMRQT